MLIENNANGATSLQQLHKWIIIHPIDAAILFISHGTPWKYAEYAG